MWQDSELQILNCVLYLNADVRPCVVMVKNVYVFMAEVPSDPFLQLIRSFNITCMPTPLAFQKTGHIIFLIEA
jgi:hypothetical protein